MPMMTDLTGAKITDFDFTYDDGTEVSGSCSLVWQNQNFVFGGVEKQRQIAKIGHCRLFRIGELDFDFTYAPCANVNNEKILLCFTEMDKDKCRSLSSPTGSYEDVPRSSYEHQFTKIAASESELIYS